MFTQSDLLQIKMLLDEEFKKFKIEMNTTFESFKKEVKNDIQNSEVRLFSEMQNLRDDLHISTDGYGDRLEEHNQRLRKIEEKYDIISS